MQKTINLQTIRLKLEKQRELLETRLAKKSSLKGLEDVLNPDKTDLANTSQTKNRETLLLDHTEQQLKEIEDALQRLEEGTYGKCTACGEVIQPARLEIIPTAALCIECQRIQDQG
jgi:DnaK suppressor protein